MKRFTHILIILGVALVLSVGIHSIWHNGVDQVIAQEVHDDDHEDEHGDEHGDEHSEHESESVVKFMNDADLKEFGIEIGTAASGRIETYLDLTGEIVLNQNRIAHLTPRISGVVSEVYKFQGDVVKKGEVIAILESRELADANAQYLAALERLKLATSTYQREEDLWQKKITSEQTFLEAKQLLAEAKIEKESTERKLHALGFSEDYVSNLPDQPHKMLTRYSVIAPFEGTVIEQHIVLGELLNEESEAFVIADLSTVWLNLSIYPKDLPSIQAGQFVVVSSNNTAVSSGEISYLSSVLDEHTRTATARVILSNSDGNWKPGLFVTGKVAIETVERSIVVPKSAIQTIDDKTVVFVVTDEGYEPQPVKTGRSDVHSTEVVTGLTAGQKYIKKGAFTIKAELGKEGFGDGHGH